MTRSIRWPFLFGFLCCAGLLGYAYYVDWSDPLIEPCPLCIIQRVVFIAMGLFFLIGGLHGARGGGAKLYGLVVGSFAGLGAAIAGRHVWLQSLPPGDAPVDCMPGVGYMAEASGWVAALGEWLPKAFEGTGDCAKVDWTFLGLSMPGWTLVWYVALGLLALIAAWRAKRIIH